MTLQLLEFPFLTELLTKQTQFRAEEQIYLMNDGRKRIVFS